MEEERSPIHKNTTSIRAGTTAGVIYECNLEISDKRMNASDSGHEARNFLATTSKKLCMPPARAEWFKPVLTSISLVCSSQINRPYYSVC